MSYLVDTNVISEIVKKKPAASVIHWFEQVPSDVLHISVLTLGEIRKGVEGFKDTECKESLRLWLENDLPEWFGHRILAIDAAVAERWGRLLYEVKRPIPAIDSLIAATALHYDLRLVTRNERDFCYANLEVIDPWK